MPIRNGLNSFRSRRPLPPGSAPQPAGAPQPQQPLLLKPGEKRPPSVQYVAIWCYCGHPGPFEVKLNEPPKKAAARKRKAMLRSCRACEEKEFARVRAEARLRWHLKQKARERLPNKSVFRATYDAAAELWQVSLAIHHASQDFNFADGATGMMTLLRRLDDRWRATLAGQAPDTPPTTT
jgi:hypothetical protein